MLYRALILSFLLILGPCHRVMAADDPDQVVQQIKTLKQSGKLDEAKALSIQYMALYPGDSDFDVLTAAILNQQRDYAGAEKILIAAHQKYPNDAEIAEMLNNMLRKQGKPLLTGIDSTKTASAISPAITQPVPTTVISSSLSTDALVLQYLKQYPQGMDKQMVTALSYYQAKNYQTAEAILQKMVDDLNQYLQAIKATENQKANEQITPKK